MARTYKETFILFQISDDWLASDKILPEPLSELINQSNVSIDIYGFLALRAALKGKEWSLRRVW